MELAATAIGGGGAAATSIRSVALITAPARVGGLESVVAALAAGVAGRGVSVTLVQLLTPGGDEAEAFGSLAAVGVDLVRLRHRSRDYVGEVREVARLLDRTRPEVVHSHGQRADLIARMARPASAGLVSTVHGFVANTVRARVVRRLHQFTLRGFGAVVGVSAPLTDALAHGLPPNRAHCVPNALGDAPVAEREVARRRLGLSDESCTIGWVGRFSPEKDPQLFLRAFARVARQDLSAVLVGDGPELAGCRQLATDLGIAARCTFAGMISDAGRLFRAFDLFVMSSRTEGTPVAALEAMRAAVPVVATAVGGVPHVLRGHAGWIVPSGDVQLLADGIEEALHDAGERHRRTSIARQRVAEEYAVAAWIDRYLSLYADARPPSTR